MPPPPILPRQFYQYVLSNAIVSGAIFENNEGLTDTQKENLQKKGAIFNN